MVQPVRDLVGFAAVPANVLGCLFVGTVDEEDRVVAWYVAPREGRTKPDPNGPQPGVHGHGQDQELEGVGFGVGAKKKKDKNISERWKIKVTFKRLFVASLGYVCICHKWFGHLALSCHFMFGWGEVITQFNYPLPPERIAMFGLDWIQYLSSYYLALSVTDKWVWALAWMQRPIYNLSYFAAQHSITARACM